MAIRPHSRTTVRSCVPRRTAVGRRLGAHRADRRAHRGPGDGLRPATQTDRATGAVSRPHPLETGTEVERFCSNIADAARDRRYVLQAKELQALQQEVDKRIKAARGEARRI